MPEQKKQHFVPQTYLKSWTVNDELFTMPKADRTVRTQPTKSIAKKNHLYTRELEYFDENNKPDPKYTELILENLIFNIWEGKWPETKQVLETGGDLKTVLGTIKSFVIIQSIRTPKFLRSNREHIQNAGINIDDIQNADHYGFLATALYPDYMKSCVCEILESDGSANFITSDNPATHWLANDNGYEPLNSIALNLALSGNPNYKIFCPLNPQFLAVLSPNLGIEIADSAKNDVVIKKVTKQDVEQINRLIEHGADKMLFAKDSKDFPCEG